MRIKNIFQALGILLFLLLVLVNGCDTKNNEGNNELMANDKGIESLVYQHAKSWETGDINLLDFILHEDVVFAYPGRRLNKQETLKDLEDYTKSFRNTKIYVNKINWKNKRRQNNCVERIP